MALLLMRRCHKGLGLLEMTRCHRRARQRSTVQEGKFATGRPSTCLLLFRRYGRRSKKTETHSS